jgi:hypothetical protein
LDEFEEAWPVEEESECDILVISLGFSVKRVFEWVNGLDVIVFEELAFN